MAKCHLMGQVTWHWQRYSSTIVLYHSHPPVLINSFIGWYILYDSAIRRTGEGTVWRTHLGRHCGPHLHSGRLSPLLLLDYSAHAPSSLLSLPRGWVNCRQTLLRSEITICQLGPKLPGEAQAKLKFGPPFGLLVLPPLTLTKLYLVRKRTNPIFKAFN